MILSEHKRKAILDRNAWQLTFKVFEVDLEVSRWQVLDAMLAGEFSASLVHETAIRELFPPERVMQVQILNRLTEIRDRLETISEQLAEPSDG